VSLEHSVGSWLKGGSGLARRVGLPWVGLFARQPQAAFLIAHTCEAAAPGKFKRGVGKTKWGWGEQLGKPPGGCGSST